jgi:hypothetical protein
MMRAAAVRPLDDEAAAGALRARAPRAAAGWLVALFLLTFGTLWITRPLFGQRDAVPVSTGSASLMGEADFNLNAWILAWVAHVFVDRPAGVKLFDANIFYPASDSLAGSENMLSHLPVTAVTWKATRNIALVFKAMVLESYVLTGLATFWLVRRRTGHTLAALAGATAFAFVPLRWNAFAQPQYLATQYLVVAIAALDGWIAERRRWWLVVACGALVLQTLTCFYIGYFSFVSVAMYGAALLWLTHRATRRDWLMLGSVLALAAIVAAPIGLPYLRLRATGTLPVHAIGELVPASMLLSAYASRLVLVPFGIVLPIGLGLACVVAAARRLRGGASQSSLAQRPTAIVEERATWVLLVVSIVLSLGPIAVVGERQVPLPYQVLYYLVPGFSSLRAPGRFIFVVALAAAVLMGSALAQIARRSRRLAAALSVAAIVATLAWSGWSRLPVTNLPIHAWREGAYGRLAGEPIDGGVLEVPMSRAEGDLVGNLRHSRYMLASSVHWWPLLNGYTAYFPPSYAMLMSLARDLPDPRAVEQLVQYVAVRWVVVHLNELDPVDRSRWQTPPPGLERAGSFDGDLLLRVTLPEPPYRPSLADRRGTTESLEGTSKAPLASDCRGARLELRTKPGPVVRVPQPFMVEVALSNQSGCPWPAVDTIENGLVGLRYRWVTPGGEALPPGARSRLPHDVAPNERLETRAAVFPPGGPVGRYTLELYVEQFGVGEPLAGLSVPIEVVPFSR